MTNQQQAQRGLEASQVLDNPAYYTGTSGTLTFAEGETTKNVTVSTTP